MSHPNEIISAEVLAFLAAMLYTGNRYVQVEITQVHASHYIPSGFLQKGFGYLLQTREEKLFVNMQHRLQQASINDRERRILLSQLESRTEAQKDLVISHCMS